MQNYKMRIGTHSVDEAGNALATALSDWLKEYGPVTLFRTCVTCTHMSVDGPAHCAKFGMTPPAAVITKACDEYVDNEEIPF